MSAVSQGSKIAEQAKRETLAAEVGVTTHAGPQDAVQGGAGTTSYPAKFDARDPRDDLFRMKQDLMSADGSSPFGVVQATDADFRYLQRKEAAAEAANFDSWFGSNFHTNDIATRRFAQEVNPGYYDQREQAMIERAKLALRLNLIKLRGPKNEEDLITLYGLQSGKVRLDPGWDKIGYTEDFDGIKQENRFKRGLMSLRTILDRDERAGNMTNTDNPFRQAGPPSYFVYPGFAGATNNGWGDMLEQLK